MFYYKVPIINGQTDCSAGSVLCCAYPQGDYMVCQFESVATVGPGWVKITAEEFEENWVPAEVLPGDGTTFVTPEKFGAKGDGVTDDSTAFANAIRSGKKVVCDGTKTYYFANPVDVRTVLRGHLDGNNAHFVNFHIYINVNETFNGQHKAYTADRFTIENMVLGNEHSWTQVLEGWEIPCITSGSPMIIRNIITKSYPYVYALVGTYIDLIQVEQWTNAVNWALYEDFDINLDAISYVNSNGHYARFDNTDRNTISGDGWKLTQCQEFYCPSVPEYKFFRVRSRWPVVMEECVQCSVEAFDDCSLVVIGCHYENALIELNSPRNNGKITFINTYFYPTHTIIDSENVVYMNCFFQCVEDIQAKRTLATMTSNKSWYDLKCDLVNCMCPTGHIVDTRKLNSYKNAPKKTYNTTATHYAADDFNGRTATIENRWFSTYFDAVGEYTYDIYLLATSLEDVALAHKNFTVNLDDTEKLVFFHSLYLTGGFGLLAIRKDPDGKLHKTEYYIDPSLPNPLNKTVALQFRECGSLAMFHVRLGDSTDNYAQIATPWVSIDSAPKIAVNDKLFEANGALVTSDGSIHAFNEWNLDGVVQVQTKDAKFVTLGEFESHTEELDNLTTEVNGLVISKNLNDEVYESGTLDTYGREIEAEEFLRSQNFLPVKGGRNISFYADLESFNNLSTVQFEIVQYDKDKNPVGSKATNQCMVNEWELKPFTLYETTAYIRFATMLNGADIGDIKVAIYYTDRAEFTYIPRWIEGEEKWVLGEKIFFTSPNGTMFTLAVSDNGTIAVQEVTS